MKGMYGCDNTGLLILERAQLALSSSRLKDLEGLTGLIHQSPRQSISAAACARPS